MTTPVAATDRFIHALGKLHPKLRAIDISINMNKIREFAARRIGSKNG